MKKTLKKALAILLATLVLLGVGAVSASAAPWETPTPRPALRAASIEPQAAGKNASVLEITAPGKAQATLYDYGRGHWELDAWDLGGMVLKASGGNLAKPQTINCDEVYTDEARRPQAGKIVWDVWLSLDWKEQSEGWLLGENPAILYVSGCQYTAFVPTDVIDGVQYGYFERESVFSGSLPIAVTGVTHQTISDADKKGAVALSLGVPANVSIAAWDWETEDQNFQMFRFTPTESGLYVFQSAGARYGQTLWTEDGGQQRFPDIYPIANLFDENGSHLTFDYSSGGDWNFLIRRNLEAGKTYYLRASTYHSAGGDYTFTVESEAHKRLTAITDKLSIKVGEFVRMADLLAGTTWDLNDLRYDMPEAILGYWSDYSVREFAAYKTGKGTIIITAPDGERVEIEVTVKPSLSSIWQTIKNVPRNIVWIFQDLFWTGFSYGPLMSVLALFVLIPAIPLMILVLPLMWLYTYFTDKMVLF